MQIIKRSIVKDDKTYNLTYDEYNTLDTIVHNGKAMVSTQRVARQIVNNADKFAAYKPVKGFQYV